MHRNIWFSAAAVLTFAFTLTAATPVIGLVQATGDFRLNQTYTRGNGTLFEGTLLETTSVRTDVSLSAGGRLTVAPNSKTRVYKDHAVLESGSAETAGYKLIAANLAITGSSAQVIMDSPTRLRVGALTAPVDVRNSQNLLIARVTPGHTLRFENAGQGGAAGPVSITGTVVKSGDKYTITDPVTNVTYELQGKDLDKKVGKKVKVVGAIVPGGAGPVPVVAVTSIAIATAVGVGVGLSTAAIAGIVVAGAAAGALGIAAGVGAFSSASTN